MMFQFLFFALKAFGFYLLLYLELSLFYCWRYALFNQRNGKLLDHPSMASYSTLLEVGVAVVILCTVWGGLMLLSGSKRMSRICTLGNHLNYAIFYFLYLVFYFKACCVMIYWGDLELSPGYFEAYRAIPRLLLGLDTGLLGLLLFPCLLVGLAGSAFKRKQLILIGIRGKWDFFISLGVLGAGIFLLYEMDSPLFYIIDLFLFVYCFLSFRAGYRRKNRRSCSCVVTESQTEQMAGGRCG